MSADYHFGIVRLTPTEEAAAKRFAAERGLWRPGPLGEAFWAEACDPATVTPRGMGGSHESAGDLPAALQRVVESWLLPAGHASPVRWVVPPFGFKGEGVAQAPGAQGLWLADPRRLIQEWPGTDDALFQSRSRHAWRRLLMADATALDAPDAARRETLELGVHRWLHEMARAAWEARVFWAVRW